MTNAYCVEYKMFPADDVKKAYPLARNSVTHQNGRYWVFNTFEGNLV